MQKHIPGILILFNFKFNDSSTLARELMHLSFLVITSFHYPLPIDLGFQEMRYYASGLFTSKKKETNLFD
jgi:hypothetical protein